MGHIKSRRTLWDDIEKLKESGTYVNKSRRRFWLKIIFSLAFLFFSYFLGLSYYAVLFLLVIELFRCVLAKWRFRKNKNYGKELKQQEIMIRTAVDTILLLYFILVGLAFAVYGCMYYVLQVADFWFVLKEWMQYSILLLLLFEIIVLMFYRKIEREVR